MAKPLCRRWCMRRSTGHSAHHTGPVPVPRDDGASLGGYQHARRSATATAERLVATQTVRLPDADGDRLLSAERLLRGLLRLVRDDRRRALHPGAAADAGGLCAQLERELGASHRQQRTLLLRTAGRHDLGVRVRARAQRHHVRAVRRARRPVCRQRRLRHAQPRRRSPHRRGLAAARRAAERRHPGGPAPGQRGLALLHLPGVQQHPQRAGLGLLPVLLVGLARERLHRRRCALHRDLGRLECLPRLLCRSVGRLRRRSSLHVRR
mmetsp:Transcript_8046/g.24930  ORF Transcript_8046/g.24930 Transcript_8046/m.24930 type:complete len:266 (+) Transcript_8046:266-1063(+)